MGTVWHLVSRHPVLFALVLVVVAFAVITIVKARQGDWFSFR